MEAPTTRDARATARVGVVREVVRAGVNLPRDPRIHFAIAVENAIGRNQARRVERMAGEPRIGLYKAARLNEYAVLFAKAVIAVGVFVRNWHRQLIEQFFCGFIYRCGVREFGKCNQLHIAEWTIPHDGTFGHYQHVADVGSDLAPVLRVRSIRLASGGKVT